MDKPNVTASIFFWKYIIIQYIEPLFHLLKYCIRIYDIH